MLASGGTWLASMRPSVWGSDAAREECLPATAGPAGSRTAPRGVERGMVRHVWRSGEHAYAAEPERFDQADGCLRLWGPGMLRAPIMVLGYVGVAEILSSLARTSGTNSRLIGEWSSYIVAATSGHNSCSLLRDGARGGEARALFRVKAVKREMRRSQRDFRRERLAQIVLADRRIKSEFRASERNRLQKLRQGRRGNRLGRSQWLVGACLVLILTLSNYLTIEVLYQGAEFFEGSLGGEGEELNGGAREPVFWLGVLIYLILTASSAASYDRLLKVAQRPYPAPVPFAIPALLSGAVRILAVSGAPVLAGFALGLTSLTLTEKRIVALVLCVPLTFMLACIGAFRRRHLSEPKELPALEYDGTWIASMQPSVWGTHVPEEAWMPAPAGDASSRSGPAGLSAAQCGTSTA